MTSLGPPGQEAEVESGWGPPGLLPSCRPASPPTEWGVFPFKTSVWKEQGKHVHTGEREEPEPGRGGAESAGAASIRAVVFQTSRGCWRWSRAGGFRLRVGAGCEEGSRGLPRPGQLAVCGGRGRRGGSGAWGQRRPRGTEEAPQTSQLRALDYTSPS